MKNIVFSLTLLAVILSACNKSSSKKSFILEAPDGSIVLASSQQDLLDKINTSIGQNDASGVINVEFSKCNWGYYGIVAFSKKNGKESNIIFSKFPLATKSLSTIIQSDRNRGNFNLPTCYEYWCTPEGSCTSCGVRVNDPFGNPSLSCSCEECHLHQKQYECE